MGDDGWSKPLGDIVLKMGDFISIRQDELGGEFHLDAQGVLDHQVTASKNARTMDDCVFQVCVRTRVSASEDLREFETRLKTQPLSGLEFAERERQQELYATLQRVYNKEREMNEKLQIEQQGAQLKYGDVIQLMHVQSGRFLSCAEHGVSLSEPENFRVQLMSPASMLSWFTIQPAKAFVNRAEDPVYNLSEVYLAVSVREDEFLHLSRSRYNEPNLLKREADELEHHEIIKRSVDKRNMPNLLKHEANKLEQKNKLIKHEVNTSLDKTPWKLCLFSTYEQTPDQIFAADVVCVREPEDQLCMLIDERDKVCFSKFAKLKGSSAVHTHASAYFVVEKHQRKMGGAMRWDEPVILRNINSGNRIRWDDGSSQLVCVEKEKVKDRKNNCLDFMAVQAQDKFVRAGHALKVGCGDMVGDKLLTIKAGKVEIRDGSADKASDEATPLLIEKVTREDRIELMQGLCALPQLKIIAKDLRQCEFDREHFQQKVKSFVELQDHLVAFMCTGGTHTETISRLVLTIPRRQQLLQEQGVVKQLLDIIECLHELKTKLKKGPTSRPVASDDDPRSVDREGPGSEPLEVAEANTSHSHVPHSRAIDDVDFSILLNELGEACFRTLRVLLIKAPLNQLFVSERFKVLLASVEQGETALSCITEMLENNRTVHDTKVSSEEIDLFVGMLRRTQWNAMVLNMLGAFCSCMGTAVKKNQCMVAQKMLTDHPDVLAQLHADTKVL
jgi:hypothetical protein